MDPENLLPDSGEVLPAVPSVLEVNGLGEVTADEVGIGDMGALDGTMYDPFAFRPDMGEEDEHSPSRVANDPVQSSYVGGGDSGGSYVGGTSGDTGIGVVPNVSGFDEEQISNARIIAEVGKDLGASDRDIQIALMAAIVESNLRNLDYGDRDSIGMFQQRDAWGSREARLDPYKTSRMFFLGGAAGQEGLLDKEDREKMSMGQAAQSVQVSAYPERYDMRQGEAVALFSAVAPGKVHRGYFKGKDPYALTEYNGKTVDYMTAAALTQAEKFFGSPFNVTQGSHNPGGVSASGGTHDGGGVVDIILPDGRYDEAVAALRRIGFAAWHRTSDQGPWPEHIHAVLVGHKELSPQAHQQVISYLNNDNGLAGSAMDDGPRDWVNNRFEWGEFIDGDPHHHERERVVSRAHRFLGTPFKWGGEDYQGVDSAGFVRAVYKDLGVDLPRTAFDQAYVADPIPVEEAKIGDMIAWDPRTGRERLGIYIGHGLIASADEPGMPVQINELGDVTSAWGIPMPALIQRATRVSSAVPQPTAYSTGSYPTPSSSSSYDDTPRGYGSPSTSSGGGGSRGGGGGSNGGGGGHNTPDPRIPDFGA